MNHSVVVPGVVIGAKAKAIFVWHQNFQVTDEMELTSSEINLPHNLDEIISTQRERERERGG